MKKFFSVVRTLVVVILTLAAICMMIFTIVSVKTFDRNDRDLFGYKAFIVQSDSMKASNIEAGDLTVVKEVDPTTLQPGDIIAYESENEESYGETITHMIRSVTVDENGELGFVTYGTSTNTDDEKIVSYTSVLGKYQVCLPKVGTFFYFLKTTPGYICCIFIPFLLLIGLQGLNTVRLFHQYKREQMEELAEEGRKLEVEREENAKLLEELRALKEQMTATSDRKAM
jgi:signal peptidase I